MAFHVWKKALGCTTFQPHWKAFFNPKAPLLAQKNDALRLARRPDVQGLRFQREAEVLASLNHPNIGAIYGLEKSGDTRALVLELVEGPTLADRITQGPIPLDEALPIAKQIAEALEAAHEAGVST